MLIIVISILTFEFILINFIREYYYTNVEEILSNQIKLSSDFYSRYFSNNSLEENIMDNVDVFWKQTNAQVQIIDRDGNILMDSIGINNENKADYSDFKKALEGKKGKWVGNVDYDDSKVISVSYPLFSDEKIVGVIRYTSSLREINEDIMKISILFLIIGFTVIVAVFIFSAYLADSIIGPIKSLTKTAEKMAKGNLNIKNKKISDDEVGKLSDTLNFMAEEILKKEQLKNEFISSVSHELRTPLTAIKGWAITLNTDNLDDKVLIKEGLTIIENESERLSNMVEELLDFSKLISGKVTVKKEKTNIDEIIYYIEKYLSPRAKRENIDSVVNCEDDIPKLFIDKNRIKQVLINILDNAFKFIKEVGERKVTLSCGKSEDFIVIKVEDTGYGISKEELPKIKEKFYKGKSSKSQNGIGLSICDEIVKMHGGDLIIESEINVGTTVYIKLPIKE